LSAALPKNSNAKVEMKPLITSLNLVATADIHFGYFSLTPAAVRQIETLVKAPLLIRLPD
jgi:hypothetical protein